MKYAIYVERDGEMIVQATCDRLYEVEAKVRDLLSSGEDRVEVVKQRD